LHTKQQYLSIIRPIRQTYFIYWKVNIKKDSKTKNFSILFKENYKNWFRYIKVKIKGKKAYYSIELSRTEYTWIYKEKETANVNRKGKLNTKKAITTNITDNSKVDNFTNKFEQIKDL